MRKKRIGFVPRPALSNFLEYLFANHHVMVWSSGQADRVREICRRIFSGPQFDALVAIWARDKLRLSKTHYEMNIHVYKQLSWIWEDPTVTIKATDNTPLCARAPGVYCQANTVLVDDSWEKACAEPFNLLKVSEYDGGAEEGEGELMVAARYLDILREVDDVSAYMRARPFQSTLKDSSGLQARA